MNRLSVIAVLRRSLDKAMDLPLLVRICGPWIALFIGLRLIAPLVGSSDDPVVRFLGGLISVAAFLAALFAPASVSINVYRHVLLNDASAPLRLSVRALICGAKIWISYVVLVPLCLLWAYIGTNLVAAGYRLAAGAAGIIFSDISTRIALVVFGIILAVSVIGGGLRWMLSIVATSIGHPLTAIERIFRIDLFNKTNAAIVYFLCLSPFVFVVAILKNFKDLAGGAPSSNGADGDISISFASGNISLAFGGISFSLGGASILDNVLAFIIAIFVVWLFAMVTSFVYAGLVVGRPELANTE
jgi:hypothetical protein